MAVCAYCRTETLRHESGLPVCERCANEPQKTRDLKALLFKALAEATERSQNASEIFLVITGKLPSGIPLPDGTQRIHDASRDAAAARTELLKAHKRLNDFLERGIVPDDLKRSG